MKEKEDVLDEAMVYEVGFHILPNISDEELQAAVSKIRDTITANDGVIFADEFPRMKDLAYEIKKRVETKYLNFNKAFFGWMKFEALSSAVNKIKEQLDSNKSVLRFIIVKTVKENTMHTPKAPVTMRSEADGVPISSPAEPVEKTEVSEAEIDKSIDELLVSEN
jgi:ribosomal protein S6